MGRERCVTGFVDFEIVKGILGFLGLKTGFIKRTLRKMQCSQKNKDMINSFKQVQKLVIGV